MTELRFKLDDDYLMEAVRKYRRQHWSRCSFLAVKLPASLILAGLAVWAVTRQSWGLAVLFSTLIALLLCAHFLDYCIIRRRFRKSPYRGEYFTVILSADGYHSTGVKSDVRLTWDAFTKACRFNNGFLIFQGPGGYNWLPVSAIVKGSALELEDLVRDHIKNYTIVEPAHAADGRTLPPSS